MSPLPYAVTGSTGYVGGRVARLLAEAWVTQRLVVRDAARAPSLPGATVAVASYDDTAAMETAFAGAETLFMVSAAENRDRVAQHFRCVDAAAAVGVQRIVYTSFLGAAADSTFTLGRDHWATEQRIRASGLAWTILRDNFYADFVPMMVGEDGAIRGPAGDGRAALVARDDVADVAVRVLLEVGQHDGRTYGLTGPEALSFNEIAALLSTPERPVTYVDETLEEAYASRAHYGAPDWQVDAWVSTYTAIAEGNAEIVTGDVERVTGRPARSLAELIGRSRTGQAD
jgi:NAD(P)H dehydrogenase (quinone)